VVVAGANRNDFKLAAATLEALVVKRPPAAPGADPRAAPKFGLCLDQGYDFAEVYELLEREGYVPHIRPVGEDALLVPKDPEYRARRWVVERTHSWMNRFRALLVRWQKGADSFLGLVQLACAIITFRQAGLFG